MVSCRSIGNYPRAPKGYAPDEYEYLKEKLLHSNFDLSIESLCRSCKNYVESGRFVEFQSNYTDRFEIKIPKKVLNVLFQNSVWYCSYELTPKSNLMYSLKIANPHIVNLNVEGELTNANVYKKPLTKEEARLWYEAILEEINNNPQERVLVTDCDNLPEYSKLRDWAKRTRMGRERSDGFAVSYIKVVDDIKYLILFNFNKHRIDYGPSYVFGPDIKCSPYAMPSDESGSSVDIWIRILSVGEELLDEIICKEKKEIEMEEYIRKQKEEARKREEEERKRREEEERMRKEEEERRRAEEIKRQAEIKYKAEISKLL